MEQFNNAIRHGFAIVVEGYFDRLRWIQAGYDNVLCVMSNELSPYKRMILIDFLKLYLYQMGMSMEKRIHY